MGKMLHKDRRVYNGSWRADEYKNIGVLIEHTGSWYHGMFSASSKFGYGCSFSVYEGAVYEGHFANGKAEGHGWWFDIEGSSYRGEWTGGKRNGSGVYYFAPGAPTFTSNQSQTGAAKHDGSAAAWPIPLGSDVVLYDGEWVAGLRQGDGRAWYAKGEYYTGHFEAGQRAGEGTTVFGILDDTHIHSITGSYESGLLHGRGSMEARDGGLWRASWERGQPVGDVKLMQRAPSLATVRPRQAATHAYIERERRERQVAMRRVRQQLATASLRLAPNMIFPEVDEMAL